MVDVMLKRKRRSVYTLPAYDGWSNQQLTKNCGIVPYLLYKNFGFHAVMAGARVESSYPYIKYVTGMDVEFLTDGGLPAKLDYIKKRATDMDLLILHGYYPDYVEMVNLYRRLRPDGKIYLELDVNLWLADRTSWRIPKIDNLLKECDVIGASCRFMQRNVYDEIAAGLDLAIASENDEVLDALIAQAALAEDTIAAVYEELRSLNVKYLANRFKESLIDFRLFKAAETKKQAIENYFALRKEMNKYNRF